MMSEDGVAPRAYVPGRDAFLIVLFCIGFVGRCIDPHLGGGSPSGALGAAMGGAVAVGFLPGLVGLFTFWNRDPAGGLAGKVGAPAVIYGVMQALLIVGETVEPGQGDPSQTFSIFGGVFALYAGALVIALYLVQFAGRWRARRKQAA